MSDVALFDELLTALCRGTEVPEEFGWVAGLVPHHKTYFACELRHALEEVHFASRLNGKVPLPAAQQERLKARVAQLVKEWQVAARLDSVPALSARLKDPPKKSVPLDDFLERRAAKVSDS